MKALEDPLTGKRAIPSYYLIIKAPIIQRRPDSAPWFPSTEDGEFKGLEVAVHLLEARLLEPPALLADRRKDLALP